MTDVDQRLSRLLHDAVPQPPHQLNGEPLRRAGSRRQTQRRLWAPLVTALAVVAVAGVAVALNRAATDHRPVAPQQPALSTTTALTVRAVDRLLAAAPALPGATRVDHAPTPALRVPISTWGDIDHVRWSIAPGTITAVLAYFAAHLPPGLTRSGTGTSGGPGPHVQGAEYAATGAQWVNPTAYTGLELVLTATQLGNRVAIRIDAQAIHLTERTAAEHVPAAATSVDVTIERGDQAARITRTLPASQARTLAAILNRLPTAVVGRYCAADRGFTDTLVFHTPDAAVRVTVEVGGCNYVTVSNSAGPQPALADDSHQLDRAITHTLNLPSNYGDR